MTAQHTPGPWVVLNTGSPTRGSAWRDVCSMGTEFTPSYVGEALEHDAYLIAAAPGLLAALIAFDDAFSHYCEGDPDSDEVSALYQAREAIAKATGEV